MKIHNPFRTALIATLGVGLGILAIHSLQALSTVLLYVGTALFISLGLEPVIAFLERRGFPRWAATLSTILGVLGLFAGVVLIVLPVLISQISQLIPQVTSFLQRPSVWQDIAEWVNSIFPALEMDEVTSRTQQWLTENIAQITTEVLNVTLAVGSGLFGALIVLVLTIYFTASTPAIKRAVYQLAPASRRERFISIAEQITNSVGYYVMGQVSLGAINGVLSFIFLSIVQAPFPAVLAVIAFFFSLIPLVGTLTGSTIIVLICLIPGIGSPTTAIVAAIWYVIYMQVEAYVISPRIMSRAVSVPGAVIVIAALAGGTLLQLLGALIAIPVAASVLIIYRQVIVPRMNER